MNTSRLRRAILPVLILWLAFGLRLYHLDFQSIWWDEGHSLFVAGHPLLEIPTLPAMDVHPPAYFALLRVWQALTGSSVFALRYLSVIFNLLTVALLWRFTRTIVTFSLAPPLVTALAALSPLYVAYAQEVRSYALITFLALASTFALWQLVTQPTTRTRCLITYIGLTAACLYTHYFTIFLLLFQNLIWVSWVGYSYFSTRKFRPQLILWLGTQLATLLLFLPQLRLALRQITTYTNPNLTPPTLLEFISRTWQAYTVGLTIDPGPAQWGMWILGAILLISSRLLISKNQLLITNYHAKRPITIPLFLTAWLLIPLAAYYLVLQRQPSFEPRYLMLVTPALFLLLGLSLTSVTSHALRTTHHVFRIPYFVFLSLPFFIFILALHSYYTNETFFKDDSAGVAAWLAGETTSQDIVYVDVPHPFHYYAAQIPAPTRYLFVNIHTAAETLNREAADKSRLFWLTWRGSDTDPRGVIPFLAEKAGRRAGQRDFRGYQIDWFELPPGPATFSLPIDLDPVAATFGEALRLDGLAYSATVSPDRPAWATLHFSLLQPTTVNYKASLRLRDEAGQIIAQDDRDLLNDRHFRTAAWPVGDPALNQAINVYLLPLSPEVPPGTYQLELVIYNAEPPYPSEGVSGLPSTDGVSAMLGAVIVGS